MGKKRYRLFKKALTGLALASMITVPNSNAYCDNYVVYEESAIDNYSKEFKSIIDNFETDIPYSDLFKTYETLEKQSNNTYEQHNDSTYRVNTEELFNTVKANNDKYSYVENGYKKLSDEDIWNLCEKITDNINYYIENNEYIDTDVVKNNVSNLKIFTFDDIVSNSYVVDASYTKESVFLISESVLNGDDIYYNIDKIVSHEIAHLLQRNGDTKVGISEYSRESSINPLFFKWLYESGAEQMALNKNENMPMYQINYEDLMEIFHFIKSSIIFNGYNKKDSLENVSASQNPSDLYDLFNAKTLDEKEKIAKILYTYEIVTDCNSKEFQLAFSEKNNKDLTISEWSMIFSEMHNAATNNVNVIFYKNLTDYILKNNPSKEEVYSLIRYHELELENLIDYNIEYRIEQFKSVLENYIDMQNAFFNSISTYYGLDYETIKSEYENGTLTKVTDENLSENSSYINNRLDSIIKDFTTVSTAYNNYNNQKVLTY